MSVSSSPNNPSGHRVNQAGYAAVIFHLLRMFWLTELVLLLLVSYGLYAGWSAPRQWSDAFFYAAVAQVFFAVLTMLGSTEEVSAAKEVRYVTKGDISETRHLLDEVASRKMTFSLRVFIGSLLTYLISVLITTL